MLRTLRFFSLVCISSALVTACSGSGSNTVSPEPQRQAGMLSPAANTQALEQSIKQGLKNAVNENNSPLGFQEAGRFNVDGNFVGLATPEAALAADSGGSSSFTTTYTVEQDVGEADIVKYDGEILYNAYRPQPDCAACLTVGFAPTPWQIDIHRTDVPAANAERLSTIELNSDLSVQGMYLPEAGRLVVIQSSNFYGGGGPVWILPWYWEEQRTRISVYDTSDPVAPSELLVHEFDGAYTASRLVDGQIYLVSRYTPQVDDLPVYYSASDDVLEAAEAQIDGVALASLTADLQTNGQQAELFEPTDCFVPTDSEVTPETAVITSISVLPVNDPAAMRTSCYTGDVYGMYMSTEALYLSSQRYEYTETSSADFTIIHKFALQGSDVEYRGSAEIPGTLGHGEQLDFRLSEHDGYLRVVTSEYQFGGGPIIIFEDDTADAGADSIDHRVTVLQESATAFALDTVSTLPNESQPAEIGKPDERLFGVRFFGERAYLVTFQQIDPLYVIDLADPENPRIAGEVEVPGVADFLHPVSADLLLTLGRSVELVDLGGDEPAALFQGVKLELFDVSDLTTPTSISTIEIGDRGTYTEALFDRHAFTYQSQFNGQGTNDRFALPIDIYADRGNGEPGVFWNQEWVSSGLHLFEINNPADPTAAQLVNHGALITQSRDNDELFFFSGQRRSIFDDDTIYLIGGERLWSSYWSDPSILNSLQ